VAWRLDRSRVIRTRNVLAEINRRMRIELVYGSLPDTALARALSDIFLVRETQRAEQQRWIYSKQRSIGNNHLSCVAALPRTVVGATQVRCSSATPLSANRLN